MNLVNYSLFGDEKEYCDITFENDLGCKATISIIENGHHRVECDNVEIDELLEVFKMIKEGKIVIALRGVEKR